MLTGARRFKSNKAVMKQSCKQWNVPNNSEKEISDIYNAVKQVSGETNVDARFILAVLMQESNGCVRVPTTNWGVRNPGLMQDHDGSASCNEGGVQTPCPTMTINAMIRNGVAGTLKGDGLVQLLQKSGGSQEAKYYTAARMYNSGSVAASGQLEHGIATHCYASDVANRLVGWVHSQKTCNLDGTPAPAFAISAADVDEAPEEPYTPPAPPAPKVAPAPPKVELPPAVAWPVQDSSATQPDWAAKAAPVDVEPKIAVESGAMRAFSSQKAPGVTSDCAEYYNVQGGDFCLRVVERFAISFDQLRQMNKELDAGCSNLWLGYDYCVKGL